MKIFPILLVSWQLICGNVWAQTNAKKSQIKLCIAGKDSGLTVKELLLENNSLSACNVFAPKDFTILSFKMSIMPKGDSAVLDLPSNESFMSGEMKKVIAKCKPGSRVLINYIRAKYDGKVSLMDPISFTIAEKRYDNQKGVQLCIADLNGGVIDKEKLLSDSMVHVCSWDSSYGKNVIIKGFKLSVFQRGKDAIEMYSVGNVISEKMKRVIASIRPGDKVYFEFVEMDSRTGKEKAIFDPLVFTIK